MKDYKTRHPQRNFAMQQEKDHNECTLEKELCGKGKMPNNYSEIPQANDSACVVSSKQVS